MLDLQLNWHCLLSVHQLLREDIDSYNAGTEISTFQMEGAGPPQTLQHKITIDGVKLDGSFINITIHPNFLSPLTSPSRHAEYTVVYAVGIPT